jgi:hypothetical protein
VLVVAGESADVGPGAEFPFSSAIPIEAPASPPTTAVVKTMTNVRLTEASLHRSRSALRKRRRG